MNKTVLAFAITVFLASTAAFAQDDTALLNFQVIRDYSGKPIRNASVVMHPVQKNGQQSKGGLQLKTDADGKASFDGAPMANCEYKCWLRVSRPSVQITMSISLRLRLWSR